VKLNRAERLLVNNPGRALVQRLWEAPLLRSMGGSLENADVLEIGCGAGGGATVLLDHLGARTVTAIDSDPEQIRRAQRRLVKRSGNVRLAVATADQLPFPEQCFDAVADFGVLHHVGRWQVALREVKRVLKPSGRFLFEEVTRAALEKWLYRTFLDHPKENRFSEQEFIAELTTVEIELLAVPRSILKGDIFAGVAKRV
jgi:ubiquinone/menaquinone biosynthesis C-methylase UbiE